MYERQLLHSYRDGYQYSHLHILPLLHAPPYLFIPIVNSCITLQFCARAKTGCFFIAENNQIEIDYISRTLEQ